MVIPKFPENTQVLVEGLPGTILPWSQHSDELQGPWVYYVDYPNKWGDNDTSVPQIMVRFLGPENSDSMFHIVSFPPLCDCERDWLAYADYICQDCRDEL